MLVFAHADCPTSALALRRLAALDDAARTSSCIYEDPPETAARLARRAGFRFPVLTEARPYEVSQAFGVETVPDRDSHRRRLTDRGDTVVGWDAAGFSRPPRHRRSPATSRRRKPGCGARWTYEPAAGGLDELEDMFERGWSDGLPVVPPTPERVEAMLGGRDPDASLGAVPPAHGEATLERVAACAVLAGCRPAYFPVVVAAVEAALDPVFNAHGLAVTTQPAGPIVVVNGPGREELGFNAGMGALGPGSRANSTVGRALRLVLTLTGGARPGGLDRADARPARASSPAASPRTRRRARGSRSTSTAALPPAATTVTARRGRLPALDLRPPQSKTPEELATTLAWAAAGQWSPFWWPMDDTSLFVVCPEHAALFAGHGWSKERLPRRRCSTPCSARPAELRRGETTPLRARGADDDRSCTNGRARSKILIVVAGGEAGRFSAVFGPCDGMKTQPS